MSSNQAEEVTIIRTLNCELCDRFDSILLTQSEIEYRCDLNSLKIGSHSINHNDHIRITYFDRNGSYLGDTISLNVADVKTQQVNLDYPVFKQQSQSKYSQFRKKLLQWFLSQQHKVCIVGPSYAGKTSLAIYLETSIPERYSKRILHAPTMGKSLKRINLGHSKLLVYDMGGQKDFWHQWERHLVASDKIIFVIDGTANNSEEAIEALDLVLSKLSPSKSLLVLINKIDLVYDGYTEEFLDGGYLLQQLSAHHDNLWISTTSIYNGLAYDYTESQQEYSLAKVILDFLDR